MFDHNIVSYMYLPLDNLFDCISTAFLEETKWMNFFVRTFWISSTTVFADIVDDSLKCNSNFLVTQLSVSIM